MTTDEVRQLKAGDRIVSSADPNVTWRIDRVTDALIVVSQVLFKHGDFWTDKQRVS